jgi:hypothetical protein
MTGKTFKFHVITTIVLLSVLTAITLVAGVDTKFAEASRAAVPAFVAVAAGWITYCLQRRVSYINSLRSLWDKVVEAVQNAIQYTYKTSPSDTDFNQVMYELSCRIDDVRGVFRNVGESYVEPNRDSKKYVKSVRGGKTIEDIVLLTADFKLNRDHIGVYPFESLKQIRGTIKKLGFGSAVTADSADAARRTIANLWKITRYELSKELDRDYPAFPDTPYDGRVRGRAPGEQGIVADMSVDTAPSGQSKDRPEVVPAPSSSAEQGGERTKLLVGSDQ